jgi:hypothetical protein
MPSVSPFERIMLHGRKLGMFLGVNEDRGGSQDG